MLLLVFEQEHPEKYMEGMKNINHVWGSLIYNKKLFLGLENALTLHVDWRCLEIENYLPLNLIKKCFH